MGYTTNFTGKFNITPSLLPEDNTFLTNFASTRRVARNLGPEYGIEGEFCVEDGGRSDNTVINYNRPPSTQPGLYCQWIPTEDGTALVWDGNEKFYDYVEWLRYLIDTILEPRGYILNGKCVWEGESSDDMGKILVDNNVITVKKGRVVYD